VASGDLIWEQALPGDQLVERIAFAANGRAIVAVNRDRTVSLFESATGEIRCRLGKPAALPPLPSAVMLAGSPVMVSGMREEQTPVAVACSPNGRLLAFAHTEPVIHLWDLLTGEEVAQLRGHEGGVVTLAFSGDGERLLSGSLDTTALVWNMSKRAKPGPLSDRPLDAKELAERWNDLAAADGVKAYSAQRELSRHPAQVAALVRERLRPAVGTAPDRLARLVADLDSAEFAVRQRATRELEELGEQARPALEKALAGEVSLEVRQRIERVLQKMTGKAGGSQLRELRAVETLELAGGPVARQALEALAHGAPEARLTREAQLALQRLAR
jgi:hypothetical protein